jgi:hypothetical protein
MSTYDPNRRYDPNRTYEPADSTGYGIWAVLGIIALFVVVGFIYWGGSGNGPTETARAPVTHSETTGMGGNAPARPVTPAAPATTPAAPAR